MKVIKHGKWVFTGKCRKCGCVIECGQNEVAIGTHDMEDNVECPECDDFIIVKRKRREDK